MTRSFPSAETYANEPIHYPPLTVVDIGTEAAAVTEEYRNQVLSHATEEAAARRQSWSS